MESPIILRDLRLVNVTVNPMRYNAGSKKLQIASKFKIVITTDESQPGNNEITYPVMGYSPAFVPIYRAQVANFELLQSRDVSTTPPNLYIIYPTTTDTDFMNYLNKIAMWKRQRGYNVTMLSTTTVGTTTASIKSYLQTAYDAGTNRPDYIMLVGDATGSFIIPTYTQSYNSEGGEGDYPYTHLAGSDYIGDALLGRVSVSSASELGVVYGKMITYEKNVSASSDWLNGLCLVGDTSSSGISCMYTNKYIKELARLHNSDYTINEVYNETLSVSAMNAGINAGVGFFNYRGYYGMSGWSPVDANLTNISKLPHAVIITCDTGSFSSGTSRTETWIRMGTSAAPKGGISAIGMATTHTHTMFNNCLDSGIFDGIYTHNQETIGQALFNGKLDLFRCYSQSQATLTNVFAHWCNLMGDPTVDVRTMKPTTLSISYPTSINAGTNSITVIVGDTNHNPIKDACVTLYVSETQVYQGYSAANGYVTIPIPNTISSAITLTVSKHDCTVATATITVNTTGSVSLQNSTIVDNGTGSTTGDSDGVADAGETIGLTLGVKNFTSTSQSTVTGTISTTSSYASIVAATGSYGTIASGGTATNSTLYRLSVNNSAPDKTKIPITLTLRNASGTTWTTYYEFVIRNASLSAPTLTVLDGNNGYLDPNETANLQVSYLNGGGANLQNATVKLRTSCLEVVIVDSIATGLNVSVGQQYTHSADTFQIRIRSIATPGMVFPATLLVTTTAGFSQSIPITLQIGSPVVTDPLGPDSYGYQIYDSGDTGYTECPIYNWIGIAPSEGGSGSSLPLIDAGSSSDEGDQTGSVTLAGVDLPFTFKMYGVDYTHMTVSTNGFIAMGTTENSDFRNWRLPGVMGANPMIAPFWDDLILIGNGGVYTYYDAGQHIYIVEWYKAMNGFDRISEETFQVLLYDPLYHQTTTGDGLIKFQYKEINNVDMGSSGYTPTHGNYATVGLKNQTGLVGIEYTYNNQYPNAAQPLVDGSALLITPAPKVMRTPYIVVDSQNISDANNNGILEPNETISVGVSLRNYGIQDATNVTATLSTTDSYIQLLQPTATFGTLQALGSSFSQQFFSIKALSTCPNNHGVDLTLTITGTGYTATRYLSYTVKKAAVQYNDFHVYDPTGNNNGIADPGETFQLIVNLKNTASVKATNVKGTLATSASNVTIATSNLTFGAVESQSMVQKAYQVTIGSGVTVGTALNFNLNITADNAEGASSVITIVCGVSEYTQDFEITNGNYTYTSWEWGVPGQSMTAHGGTKVAGTSLNANYENNVIADLISVPVLVQSGAVLKFWHAYEFEKGTTIYYDGGNVSVSTDNGANYSLITPTGGYPASNVSALSESGYGGTSLTYTQAEFSLAAYANQTVLIRWRMGTDNSIVKKGWFVDDISISSTAMSAPVALVSGTVLLTGTGTITDVSIGNGEFMSHPESNGTYKLYVGAGTHTLNCSLEYFTPAQITNLITTGGTAISNQNFNIVAYNKPATIGGHMNGNTIQLMWTAPTANANTFVNYQIYRQKNTENYQQIGQTTATNFNDVLSETATYRYKVVTNYSTGSSAATSIVEQAYPVTTTSSNPATPTGIAVGVNGNDVVISWNAVTTTVGGQRFRTTGYFVQQTDDLVSGQWQVVGIVSSGTMFTHTGAATNRTRYYKVTAF